LRPLNQVGKLGFCLEHRCLDHHIFSNLLRKY
jgi:hypothetical protein